MIDFLPRDAIRRIEMDLKVRKEELQRLKAGGGDIAEITMLDIEVCRLGQALNMLAGPCFSRLKTNYFF